jgi:ATP-dependent helicase/nuclease subunit B
MSVRFILGRAGSGKTRHIRDRIVETLRADPLGPPVFWILPKQATFEIERELTCSTGLGGFCRARVLSFDQLGREILNDCGGIAIPQVTALGRQMLIGRLLRKLQPQLSFFASSAHRPGLVAKLDATFAEIEHSGQDVAELAGKLADLEQAEADNAARAPLLAKIRDLRLLYAAYTEFLGQERLDPHRRITQVVESIQDCSLFRDADVYVDGFDVFAEYERQLLAGLAKASRTLEITLLMNPLSPLVENVHLLPNEMSLFHRVEQTYRQLYFTFQEKNVALDAPLLLTQSYRFTNPTLESIESRMFSAGSARFEPAGVELIECPSRRAEVDAAARCINDHLRRGLRLRDITVLMRELDDYHDLINASFREHSIPYFVDRRRPAAHHPLIQFTRSIFQITRGSWPHEAVMTLLKCGLSGLKLSQVDELENYVLLHRIRGQAWANTDPWSFRRDLTADSGDEPGSVESIELERINQIRETIVSRLRPIVQAMRGGGEFAVRDIVRDLFSLYEKFNVRTTLVEWINAATARNQFEQAGEHDQVWAELVDLFDQMIDLLGDERVSLSDFMEILDSGLERFDLALTPPTVDQVLVGQVDRARTPDVKVVILLGMNDGQFPRLSREDSILSDSDRKVLRERKIDLDPDTQRQLLDERLLGYVAMTRSSDRLCLTRSISDDESRAAGPSQFWRRLTELMPDISVDVVPRDVRTEPSRIGTPRQLVTALMGWVRAGDTKDKDSTWSSLYQWLATHGTSGDPVDAMRFRAWPALRYDNLARLSPDIAQRLFSRSLTASVSRIESFATCPFKHFASYVLKLRQREEQDVTSLDLGNIYHHILEKIVREMLSRKSDWALLEPRVAEELVREYAREVGQSLRGELMMSSARNKYLLQRIEKTLNQVISAQRAARQRGRFKPWKAELEFGGNPDDLPAYPITTPGGRTINLQGKIDRIDLLEDAAEFAVLDYKLRGDSLAMDRVYHGISLQLLTYLLVLEGSGVSLAGRKPTPVAAFYIQLLRTLEDVDHPANATTPDDPTFDLKVKPRGVFRFDVLANLDKELTTGLSDVLKVHIKADGMIGYANSSDAVQPDVFVALLEHVRRRLGELGDQIFSGTISVEPYRLNRLTPCPHCDFRAVCRFDPSINVYHTIPAMKREEIVSRLMEGKDGD